MGSTGEEFACSTEGMKPKLRAVVPEPGCGLTSYLAPSVLLRTTFDMQIAMN